MAKMSDLLHYLDSNKVEYHVVEHDPAFSAHEVAVATHFSDTEFAKAVLLHIDDHFWMAVLRADQRVNEHLIKRTFGAKHVRLALEEDLSAKFPDCQLGAMPPFGNLYGIPVMVEESLAEDDEICFNACTHTKAVRMKFKDFRRIVKPVIASFAESPHWMEDRDS